MLRKILALLEGVHVALNSGVAAYNAAMEDSEPLPPPAEAAVDTQALVHEMNDRMLVNILRARAQVAQQKLDLN